MFRVGEQVTIRPAYNSDTGERDIIDGITYCQATVIGQGGLGPSVDVEIEVKAKEGSYFIHPGRLKPMNNIR